jgi:hypothetical protein
MKEERKKGRKKGRKGLFFVLKAAEMDIITSS